MKILLSILAIAFLLIGLSEILPTFLIFQGLLEGQGSEDRNHFIFKMLLHLTYSVGGIVLSIICFRKAFNSNNRKPNSEQEVQ